MSPVTLNYLSVADDASPVEVLRAEALDGVLTRFLDQARVRRSASGVVSLVALFSGGRLATVWGVGWDGAPPAGPSQVVELRVSRRDMRPSLEHWAAVLDTGAGGVMVACVVRVDRSSGEMVMDLAYDESEREVWDVSAAGVEAVAARLARLGSPAEAG